MPSFFKKKLKERKVRMPSLLLSILRHQIASSVRTIIQDGQFLALSNNTQKPIVPLQRSLFVRDRRLVVVTELIYSDHSMNDVK